MALSVQGHSLGDVVLYFTLIVLTHSGISSVSLFFSKWQTTFLYWFGFFYVNIILSDDVLKWVCLLFVSK